MSSFNDETETLEMIEKYEREQNEIEIELKIDNEDYYLICLLDDIRECCNENGISILDNCKITDFINFIRNNSS